MVLGRVRGSHNLWIPIYIAIPHFAPFLIIPCYILRDKSSTSRRGKKKISRRIGRLRKGKEEVSRGNKVNSRFSRGHGSISNRGRSKKRERNLCLPPLDSRVIKIAAKLVPATCKCGSRTCTPSRLRARANVSEFVRNCAS